MNTEEPRSKHWNELVEILEREFPKGKCQERGQALVLLVYAEMALKKEEKYLEELAKNIVKILDGIDKDEVEYENGWWETSTGVNFGKEKLNQVLSLIKKQKL